MYSPRPLRKLDPRSKLSVKWSSFRRHSGSFAEKPIVIVALQKTPSARTCFPDQSYSPDLLPLVFLWGYVKYEAYRHQNSRKKAKNYNMRDRVGFIIQIHAGHQEISGSSDQNFVL